MSIDRVEAELFAKRRREDEAHARQLSALRLLCGLDMDSLMECAASKKERALAIITRRLRRERMKALRGHWSYDLNRHIALKQALERLRARWEPSPPCGARTEP